jgi:threonine dehydrogenase-like Zn-dependent dehydrogenase
LKTHAMVLESFKAPLKMRELEIPVLRDCEVLVRIDAAGVCGSDVHMWRGEDERTPLPIVLGHEGVGTVVDVKGRKQYVTGEALKTGDRMLWNRGVSCNGCYYCVVLNQPWLCNTRKVYGINRPMTELPGLNGCYAEHLILVDSTDIFKINDETDPAILVSASCSGATVAHAFDEHAFPFGSNIVIQGPGPLGVYAVAFARHLGASQIIVTGGSENRLQLCKDFGASAVLNRRTTSVEERREFILSRTGGRGADVVVEATGDPSAVHEGLPLLRPGGAYLSIGFSQPPGNCNVDFFKEVVRKNVKIQGVWVSGTRHTFQALRLIERYKELFGKMITHRFRLDEANEALAAMESRDALKAVLIPAGNFSATF